MPTYQIEMMWKCSQCGHSPNRGLARHCVSCGFPKNDKCEEFFPDDISESNAIRDSEKLALATAGADWKCKYCDSLQSSTGPFCSYCGSDRETGSKPWQAKVKSITQDVKTGEKLENAPTVTREGGKIVVEGGTVTQDFLLGLASGRVPIRDVDEPRPEHRSDESAWSSPYRGAPRATFQETDDIKPFATPFPWKKVGVSILVAAALAVVLWLVFRTKIVDAEVSSVSWAYKVHIDRYQVWHRDGWSADPGAFDIRNEGQRVHHYDKVVSGSHQEPYSESYSCGETCTTTPRTCTSNKNGSATCTGGDRSCSPKTCTRTAYRTVTDYRDEPRYQAWYSWNVWDWGFNRTVTKSGTDMEPGWPPSEQLVAVLQPGEQERQRREEFYQITFAASNAKAYSIEPKNYSDFMRFPRGRHVRLKVGIAHGVEVLPQ